MRWLRSFVAHHPWLYSLLIITVLVVVLAWRNYSPGTFLTGWDNLHPEFDFWLNIKRSLAVTWQEYQGVGVLGGMGHAADLPRQLLLWAASLVLPTSMLRYFSTFAMLWLGPVGLLFLIRRFVLPKTQPIIREVGALSGALFYLLNLGTLQNFYVPFETFISQYGFLPWIIWLALEYLVKPSKKSIGWLFLIMVLAAPLGYVPTVFVSTTAVVGLFLLAHLFVKKKQIGQKITQVLTVILLFVLANFYWLSSPFLFTLTQNEIVFNSKINSFVSEDARLSNQKAGNFENVALLKGYWFDYIETLPDGQVKYLLETWRQHTSHSGIALLGMMFFVIGVLGLFTIGSNKNVSYRVAFILWWVVGVFMLLNDNPPFGFIFRFLQENIPLFNEIFRYVFTKWSVVAITAYSFAFAAGIALILRVLKFLTGKFAFTIQAIIFGFVIGCLLVIQCFPMFNGYLLSPAVRLRIPNEYFETMAYFKTRPTQFRVMNLPQYTFYGWNIYAWGYGGSGWWWHGVEQPFMDRAFDVWRPENEFYYTQLNQALYSQNSEQLQKLLDTYQVGYVLLDYNLENNRAHFLPETEQLLQGISGFELTKQFGKIKIYERKNLSESNSYIKAPTSYVEINQVFGGEPFDPSTQLYDTVVETQTPSVVFPFANSSLFKPNLETRQTKAQYTVGANVSDLTLTVPDFMTSEKTVPALISVSKSTENGNEYQLTLSYLTPQFSLNGELITEPVTDRTTLPADDSSSPHLLALNGSAFAPLPALEDLSEPKELGIFSITTSEPNNLGILSLDQQLNDLGETLLSKPTQACSTEIGTIKKNAVGANGIQLTGSGGIGCISIELPQIDLDNQKNILLHLGYDYASTTNTQPSVLVKESAANQALNSFAGILPISAQLHHQSEFISLEKALSASQAAELTIEFGLVPPSNDSTYSITYQNPSVDIFKEVGSIEYQPAADISSHLKVPLKTGDQLDLSIPMATTMGMSDIGVAEENPSLTSHFKPLNCDLFNTESFNKQRSDQGITYTATNASSCDFWYYPRLSAQAYYQVLIESEYHSGKPTSICLEETRSRKCLLETKLSKQGGLEQFFTFPMNSSSGLNLRTDVHGVGSEPSETTLQSFYILPFPQSWLQKIIASTPQPIKTNTVSVTTPTHPEPNSYFFTVNASESGLLVLNQSFDKNWIAFSLSQPLKLFDHHRVNSWANGWFVPTGTYDVVVFFWPQLLSWFGFGLLIVASVAIIAGLIFSKKHSEE